MRRVYVAGAYSSDNVIGVLDNIRVGMRLSCCVLQMGYAPYCPWLDHQLHFQLRPNENISVPVYQEASMTWLEVCDAILLVPGYQSSRGTLKEIDRAIALGIPVCHDLADLALVLKKERRS